MRGGRFGLAGLVGLVHLHLRRQASDLPQLGIDLIGNPTEDLEVRFGPRASWGSQDYMSTYFGITSSEAAASPLYDKSYKADAGFNTVVGGMGGAGGDAA